jgi:putative nucleotidyltransferase with HDIG domain
MTTTSAPVTSSPATTTRTQPTSFANWLRGILRRLFGTPAPAPAGASVGSSFVEENLADIVIAPGGFAIRKPQLADASSSVDVNSFEDLVPSVRDGLKLLPPLPTIVLELLKEIQSKTSTASSIAQIAASDPSLAASLLRAVNNSAVGLRNKVTSISQAVSLLGFDAVRTLVIRLKLEGLLPHRSEASMVASEDIWTHSLVVSYIAAALVSRVSDVDRGFVSTLGLLHDIGRLAICSQHPDYVAALRAANINGEPLLAREAVAFGADHAAVGAILCNRWQLPADLNTAIRWHHSPASAFEPTDPPAPRKATFLIQIADQLAKYCFAYSPEMEIDLPADGALEALGLKGPLPSLLDAKVRAAATQAILFAEENSHRPIPLVRPFLNIHRGSEAAALARLLTKSKSPGISVGSAGADLIDGCESAFQFDSKHPTPPMATTTPYGRFTAPATPAAAEWLAKSLPAHWESAEANPRAAGCARAVLRAMLPNFLALRDTQIEIAWEWEAPTLHVAFRSRALDFTRITGAADRGPKVLESELANILNLGWFDAETSEDGSTLLLRSK